MPPRLLLLPICPHSDATAHVKVTSDVEQQQSPQHQHR